MRQYRSVNAPCSDFQMADDAMIRRANLIRLGKSPSELTTILGKTPAYWSNLMRDPKKSFGEKSARRIEEVWPLPRGWLDEPHDDEAPPPHVRLASEPTAPVDWRETAILVAKAVPDPKKRDALLTFIRFVDRHIETGQRIAESIPDIT